MGTTEQKKGVPAEIVLNYNIGEDSVYHPAKEVTRLFGVPQRIEHAQDYLIRYGVIQPDSAKEFMNLFRRIRDGAHHAECVVHAKAASGALLWMQMTLTTVFDEGKHPVRAVGTISVNLSFAQLQDQTFLPYLTRQVETGHIDPHSLHLEITESCIADGCRLLGGAIHQLRDMGFLIEMDDFGTGYSSLEILKNAPADVVKIDRAFVKDITRSDFDTTFIRFVVALYHSVGIRVCLEGVETWEEYHMVAPMELDFIQGFLFGKPQPEERFRENYLAKWEELSYND